uniref:Putative secreted protein n=1 Tax=Ixodes ricinus TaxID=34613 RepID=A0A6B0UC35_IXORI
MTLLRALLLQPTGTALTVELETLFDKVGGRCKENRNLSPPSMHTQETRSESVAHEPYSREVRVHDAAFPEQRPCADRLAPRRPQRAHLIVEELLEIVLCR